MNLRDLALRQLHDYDRHRPGGCFAGDSLTLTLQQAYDLQFQVARLRWARGESAAGFKIGCVSQAIQRQLGIGQPVFGHVFATELQATGAVLDSTLYEGLAIEGEFAVRLAHDVPNADWLRANLPQSVAAIFPVIELHNYVVRGSTLSAQELIANNGIHAGVVLPRHETPWNGSAIGEQPILVTRNGQTIGSATGDALPDFPFGSLIRLAEHLARFGLRLRQGQLVLIGSPLPLYRVSPGDRIEVISPASGAAVTATVGHPSA
ncbi:MAG: hypothetical protein R2762_18640 [Bryobacteraceae bacterium]